MMTNPMSNVLAYLGASGNRFSPRLWKEGVGQYLAPDGQLRGALMVEDFRSFGGILDSDISATIGSYVGQVGHYYSYQDSGGTITQIATERRGALRLLTDTTDNDENWLQPGSATSVSSVISDTAGDDVTVIFEARVRPNFVADNEQAWFVGLSEEGCAIADMKADNTGVLATTKDLIGFDVVQANGDAVNFVYQKASGGLVTHISGVKALTAAAWVNLGFVYNPRAPQSKRIKIFVDNVEQSTYVTATNIATATFPDGEELQPLFGHKNGSGAAASLDIDCWALYVGD